MSSRPDLTSAEQEILDRVLGPETVARICQSTETGTGLPNAAFTDPDFLALENKLLFPRTWTLAGYCHELGEPGDAVPVEVAGVPLILLRTRKGGEIKGFQNVCRHRGTQLLAEPCKGAAALACPYHGWTYSLEGKLLKRPLFEGPDGHASETDLHLYPVRTAVWHDLVFVNLDGQAPAFEDYVAPLEKQVAGYNLGSLCHAGTLTWEINANWKFIHENFTDSYHVPWCHPSLEEWTPAVTHIASNDGPVLINGNPIPREKLGDRSAGLPPFPGIAESEADRAAFFYMFPSFDLNIYPEQAAVFKLTPLEPERTFERIDLYLAPEAFEPRFDAARAEMLEIWTALNGEDIGIVEGQQKGRAAAAFDGGVLSPYWDGPASHYFAKLIAEAMTA
jgi:choline monooxygenase